MNPPHPSTAANALERETALWLALLNSAKLQRRAAKEIINHWCVRDQQRLTDLAALTTAEAAAALALPPTDTAQALQVLADTSALAAWQRLSVAQIGVITRVDAAFPEELALHLPEESLPYLLYYRGELELLVENRIAVGGSHAPESLDSATLAQLAQVLIGAALPAIGGFERGVDRELTLSAVSAGGQAVAMLPLGLEQAGAILALAQEALDSGRLLLLSPFAPETPYHERTAQARLPLVAALASGLLLVDPDQPPAAWPGAPELLQRGAPVVVVSRQDSAAVQAWATLGARVVDDAGAASELLLGMATPMSSAWHEDAAADQAAALPGVEPIYFENAEEAIQALGRLGNVPPALARRLRESSMFGYQNVPDVDIDVEATEHED